MRKVHVFLGLLIAIFPFTKLYFTFLRKIPSDFYHSLQRVTSSMTILPPFLQKTIHFYLLGFFIASVIFALCYSTSVRLKEFFFNSHSRYLTLFTFVALLSLLLSSFSRNSYHYILLINFMVGSFGFHLVYVIYKKRLDWIRPTLYAVLIVTAIECVIGIGQFFMQHHLGLQFLSEPVISPYIKDTSTFFLYGRREFFHGLFPWIPAGHKVVLRAYGTFIHPNIFGEYLAITLFISYYAFITNGKKWVQTLLHGSLVQWHFSHLAS